MKKGDTKEIAFFVPDNCGRLIGKRQPAFRLAENLSVGMPMPNFHLITGIENRPIMGMDVCGMHTGFGNGRLRPEKNESFVVPGESSTKYYICDAFDKNDKLVKEAPRSILRQILKKLKLCGLEAVMASELEFYLFKTGYSDLKGNNYNDIKPYYSGAGDNDLYISAAALPFLEKISEDLSKSGIMVDQTQGEGGEGQLEVNISPKDVLRACDEHVVFKHIVKTRARLMHQSVTFMAKPFDNQAGSGGHIHLCLKENGRALLKKGQKPTGKIASFIAGILEFSWQLTAMHLPFVNSYKRLNKNDFVPLNSCWGWDNRTCLVRLTGDEDSARLEFRLPGADSNPYFSYSALIAAGCAGISKELTLKDEEKSDANKFPYANIPRDLTEAIQHFNASEVAKKAFGEDVQQHLCKLFENELNLHRIKVTREDLERLFEGA